MPRVIYHLAASVDGFIARRNGDVSWLSPFTGDYGMRAFFKSVGSAVMGGRTWRVALKIGGAEFPGLRTVVVTRKRLAPGPERFSGDVRRLVRDLKRSGRDVWLVGGARLAAQFSDAGLLDRMVVTHVPVLLGDGIPLFAGARRLPTLKLTKSQAWRDGVVQLTYEATRSARP